MIPVRWSVPVAVSALLVGGGAATAALVVDAPRDPQPVSQAHRFYAGGPSAFSESDSGGVGLVDPLRLTTPPGSTSYDAVIEVSYAASTRGRGPFILQAVVDTGVADGTDDPSTDDLPTQPSTTRVDPGQPVGVQAATRFLVHDLQPGTTYRVLPLVRTGPPRTGPVNRVKLTAVLLTAELTPVP